MPLTKIAVPWGNSLIQYPREDDDWSGHVDTETGHDSAPRYYRPREGHSSRHFLYAGYAGNVAFEPSGDPKTGLKAYDSYSMWFANRRDDLPELLSHDGTYRIIPRSQESTGMVMPAHSVPEYSPQRVEHLIHSAGSPEPVSTNLHRIQASVRAISYIVPSNLTQHMTPITLPINVEWFREQSHTSRPHGLPDDYNKWQEIYNRFKELSQQAIAEVQGTTNIIERASSEEPPTIDEGRERLFNELYAAFDVEPFENGIAHPSEQVIASALQNQIALDWFGDFCTDIRHPDFAASVLRCLGRQTCPGTSQWRSNLIQQALATDDMEIREAAVQVVESWGANDLLDILRSHDEPESWIRDYISDVIIDLER